MFRSHCTKTLIPLDVTNRIVLTYDLFNQLPDDSTFGDKFAEFGLEVGHRGWT